MKKVKLALLLLIILLLVIIVGQNTSQIQARFLWLTAEMPVVVLLFLTTMGGFGAGMLVALFMKKVG